MATTTAIVDDDQMSSASSVTLSSSPTPSPPDEIPFAALYSQSSPHQATSPAPRRVLLFGLSANPPTGESGHLGIVQHLSSLGQWDEVWVMPVYRHMHHKDSVLVSYDHRLNMCRLNFEGRAPRALKHKGQEPYDDDHDVEQGAGPKSRVRVMKVEKEVVEHHLRQALANGQSADSVRVGTIDVVQYLKEAMPSTQFGLTLGTDTYVDLKQGKWKRGGELETLVELVVVERPGVKHELNYEEEVKQAAEQGVRVSFHKVPALSDVSSTAVRLTTDKRLLKKMLHPAVYDYLRSHHLFAFAGLTKRQALDKQKRYLRGTILCSVVLIGVILLLRRIYQQNSQHFDFNVPKSKSGVTKAHHVHTKSSHHK